MNNKQKIILAGGIVSLPLSFLNAMQEGNSYIANGLICLWSMAPFIVLFAYMKEPFESKRKDFNNMAISLFGTITGLLAYIFYFLNGQSDPDTAGHMHVLLFPFIHLLAIIIFGLLFSTISSIFYKENVT